MYIRNLGNRCIPKIDVFSHIIGTSRKGTYSYRKIYANISKKGIKVFPTLRTDVVLLFPNMIYVAVFSLSRGC